MTRDRTDARETAVNADHLRVEGCAAFVVCYVSHIAIETSVER
jgi:hypothetical protein